MKYLPLTAAAALVGVRRKGRPTHPTTLARWINEGCRGVRLQYELRGGVLVTTAEWLDAFFAAIKEQRERHQAELRDTVTDPTPASYKRRVAKCMDRLRAKGAL